MNQSNYVRVTGAMFLIFAAAHLLRFVLRVHVLVGSRTVPLGLSLAPVVIGGYLAYFAFRLQRRGV